MGDIRNIKLTMETLAKHQPEKLVYSNFCNRMQKVIMKNRNKLLNQNYQLLNGYAFWQRLKNVFDSRKNWYSCCTNTNI